MPDHGHRFGGRAGPFPWLAGPWLAGILALAIVQIAAGSGAANAESGSSWSHFGGDAGGRRYVASDQIRPDNIRKLRKAWTFRTGHRAHFENAGNRVAFEATPILVDDRLVLCTPFNEVMALDPGTGALHWRYDPQIDLTSSPANQFVCRGVTAWRDPRAAPEAPCATRILSGTNDGRLVALDARHGTPCADFGAQGQVRLDAGRPLLWPGEFQITSPPIVIGDVVVTGSAFSDNQRLEAPSGVVRAYDVRTGAARWQFDPVPRQADDPAAETWEQEGAPRSGHANVWSVMAADEERNLLFLPTSSPSPDFYGGDRPGNNLYANSVVALRGDTGQVVWHYQIVHHDIWDYDLPTQPGLYEITRAGTEIPVVVQATKTGHIFVLHRETGAPVFPVTEQSTPQDPAPGEWLSPTQPMPTKPRALVSTHLKPEDAWGLSGWDKGACRKQIETLRNEGLFTPPSLQGTIVYPFTGGGANWGGAAFDPQHQRMFINTSSMAHVVRLIPRQDVEAIRQEHPDLEVGLQRGTRYAVTRELLVSPLGLPCNPPPWGQLHAIDLKTGEIVWESVLGTTRDLTALGVSFEWGTPNFGGPVVTASGLLFIAATMDNYLRAFDADTGEELWKGRLPAGGQATPMSYVWQDRQYVVVAAGGHARLGTKLGDYVVAFALPH